ncbi:hypothetical protein [Streptomyces cadmiisoli]|uniref:hypothetical protein n=1 Tax=Streptomyces cadmiisoli TaxID=2184053 RepID=UPI003658D9AB
MGARTWPDGSALEVRDFEALHRWRRELVDPSGGRVLARHEVRPDRDGAPYEAFLDITGHMRRHTAPACGRRTPAGAALLLAPAGVGLAVRQVSRVRSRSSRSPGG